METSTSILKSAVTTALITILFSVTAKAQSQEQSCISAQDVQEIGQNFRQISQRASNGKKVYCEADLGKEWFAVTKSLEVLKNIKQNAPTPDQNDAFTFKAISESDWWSYFTNRANTFTLIDKSTHPALRDTCLDDDLANTGVVAFVFGSRDRGHIYLCPFFFEQDIYSQASVMMHEVRHFDGHGHETCSQGQESGNSGACDMRITDQGSYAISVQTIVGMARSAETPKADASLLESEALYMAFNKFNEIPEVKIDNAVILSNTDGEVFKWNPSNDNVSKIGQLNEAAVVLNSYNRFTIYPVDNSVPAYRMDKDLKARQESIGLFAVDYNKERPSEKAKYKSISYFGAGGLLKDNTLITICDNQNLFEESLDRRGEFVRMISMSEDRFDQVRTSMLVSQKGEIISFKCEDRESQRVLFEDTGLRYSGNPSDIVESFSLSGVQYAVLKDGSLTGINLTNQIMSAELLDLPIANKNWVSATPLSNPEIFN